MKSCSPLSWIVCLGLAGSVTLPAGAAEPPMWTRVESPAPATGPAGAIFRLDRGLAGAALDRAPMEFTPAAAAGHALIELPLPDGTLERFRLERSPIMAPGLAARYPSIRTYRVVGIDDPAAGGRLLHSSTGLRGVIQTAGGAVRLHPLDDGARHVSVFQRDLPAGQPPRCGSPEPAAVPGSIPGSPPSAAAVDEGPTMPAATHPAGALSPAGLPPCPVEQACTDGGGTCTATGDCSGQSLGISQCELPDGARFDCLPGQVIHTHGCACAGGTECPSDSLHLTCATSLRTYRLAVVTTGQFYQQAGGTPELAMEAVASAVNDVNAIYERDLSIRLQLVDDTDLLFYTGDAHGDPRCTPAVFQDGTNPCPWRFLGGCLIDSVLGPSSYDVGHLFGYHSGTWGCASISQACLSGKGDAITMFDPANENQATRRQRLVAHEMGHQFSARHTWSGPGCVGSVPGANFSASHAYEPGSGTTVMSYAGSCGQDAVPIEDFTETTYFHVRSVHAIADHAANHASCGDVSGEPNQAPLIAPLPAEVRVPRATPFALSGTAEDPEARGTIRYTWEQYDAASDVHDPLADDLPGPEPTFRSSPPQRNPYREFLDEGVPGSVLPTRDETLTMRLVVRDLDFAGGAVDYDQTHLVVAGQAFRVLAPVADQVVTDSNLSVSWDPGGTLDWAEPVSTVHVELSTNGGLTYQFLEAAPNADGQARVTIPTLCPTTFEARIRVWPEGESFFALSEPFRIYCPCGDQPCEGGCMEDTASCTSGSLEYTSCWDGAQVRWCEPGHTIEETTCPCQGGECDPTHSVDWSCPEVTDCPDIEVACDPASGCVPLGTTCTFTELPGSIPACRQPDDSLLSCEGEMTVYAEECECTQLGGGGCVPSTGVRLLCCEPTPFGGLRCDR